MKKELLLMRWYGYPFFDYFLSNYFSSGCQLLIFVFMQNVEIKIINTSENKNPEYATFGSSGLDLRANLPASVTLQPFERKMISTGLFLEIPEGYEIQVRPRSGLALKHGITCLNSPGTVDSDYRGEIKVILINLSGETQILHHGERIAQMVLCKVEKAVLKPVSELASSSRGEGGFGHTGKN